MTGISHLENKKAANDAATSMMLSGTLKKFFASPFTSINIKKAKDNISFTLNH
jgi:hypothetical protein